MAKSLTRGPISAGLELAKAILGEDVSAKLFASSALFPSSDRKSQVLTDKSSARAAAKSGPTTQFRADPKTVKKRRLRKSFRRASLLTPSGDQTLG